MEINNMLMLNVGYAYHDGDWNFNSVSSPFTRIYYVAKGTAEVSIGSRTYTLRPDHMYIIPAFTEHSDYCNGVFEHYYIHVYEDVSAGEAITAFYDFPFEIPATDFDRRLFQNICDHNGAMSLKNSNPRIYDNKHSLIECIRLNRERPLFDRLESMGIIYQLLGKFLKSAKPKIQTADARIEKVLKILSGNVAANNKIEDLAKIACMSPDHFIRTFRKEVGYTPAQFVIEQKMMKARLMLASENLSIKDIAYGLGYDDVSYFTRIFHRHVGTTPRIYRNSFNDKI